MTEVLIETTVGKEIQELSIQEPLNYQYLQIDPNDQNKQHPLFKGNICRYHSLPFPREILDIYNQDVLVVTEIFEALNAVCFAFNNTLMVWDYQPSQTQIHDPNFLFNPNNQSPFPSNIFRKDLSLDSQIVAITIGPQQTIYIATQFRIWHFRYMEESGHLVDILPLDESHNTNGEIVHKMFNLNEGLIFGGSRGSLRQVSFFQQSNQSLSGKIWESLKQNIKDITQGIQSRTYRVVQIEVDKQRHLCYALVEVLTQRQIYTQVLVYDLGTFGTDFRLIFTIYQDYLYRELQKRQKQVAFEQCHLVHLNFCEAQTEQGLLQAEVGLFLITRAAIKIGIRLEYSPMEVNQLLTEVKDHNYDRDFDLELDNRIDHKLDSKHLVFKNLQQEISQLMRWTNVRPFKVSSYYEVKFFKLPCEINREIPFGVYIDESRWDIFTQDLQIMGGRQIPDVDCAFSDKEILVIAQDQRILFEYSESGQIAQQSFKRQNFQQQSNQIYRQWTKNAVEVIDLKLEDGFTRIQELSQNSIMKYVKPSSQQQIQNHPRQMVLLNQYGLHFFLFFRPIDILFTHLKVTPPELVGFSDNPTPLEYFTLAYGNTETAKLLLDLILREDEDFYVSSEVELNLHKKQQQHMIINQNTSDLSQFFSEAELTPIWATGEVYCLKGKHVLEKAKLFFYMIAQRDCTLNQNSINIRQNHLKQIFPEVMGQKILSTKVMSSLRWLQQTLEPIWDKKLLNIKSYFENVYGQLCFIPVEQLKYISEQLSAFINLIDTDYRFYMKKDYKQLSQTQSQKSQRTIRGFDPNKFKLISQEYRQSQSQDISSDTDLTLENYLISRILSFSKQAKQYLDFICFLFDEVRDLRSIISRFQVQDRLFLFDMRFNQVFGDHYLQSYLLVIVKLLLIEVINSTEVGQVELGRQFCHKFSYFFDQNDYTVASAQQRLKEIYIQLYNRGLLLPQRKTFSGKLIHFIKKTVNRDIEDCLKEDKISLFYQNLPEVYIQDLEQVQITLQDQIKSITKHRLISTVKPYLIPLGMLSQFYSLMLQRASYLEIQLKTNKPKTQYRIDDNEPKKKEYEELILELNQQLSDFICVFLQAMETKLINAHGLQILKLSELQTIFNQIITALTNYPIKAVHECVIKSLLSDAKGKQYILLLRSPFIEELNIGDTEVKRLQLIHLCNQEQGDLGQSVLSAINLAKYSFLQDNQINEPEEILAQLNIDDRLEYLEQAKEYLYTISQQSQPKLTASELHELETKVDKLSMVLTLQKVVFEAVQSENTTRQYQLRLLSQPQNFNLLEQFIYENNLYIYQVLVIDFRQRMKMDISGDDYDAYVRQRLFFAGHEDKWNDDCDYIEQVLLFVYRNVKNKELCFNWSELVKIVEVYNADSGVLGQKRFWFIRFLEKLRIEDQKILNYYQLYMEELQEGDRPQNRIYHVAGCLIDLLERLLVRVKDRHFQNAELIQELANHTSVVLTSTRMYLNDISNPLHDQIVQKLNPMLKEIDRVVTTFPF